MFCRGRHGKPKRDEDSGAHFSKIRACIPGGKTPWRSCRAIRENPEKQDPARIREASACGGKTVRTSDCRFSRPELNGLEQRSSAVVPVWCPCKGRNGSGRTPSGWIGYR